MALVDTLFGSQTGFSDLDYTDCAECGVSFASSVVSKRRKDGKGFYCPNGHSLVFNQTKTEAEKLRAQLEQEKFRREQAEQDATVAREAKKWATADARRARTINRKMKQRIEAGVCLHCNRTFKQLAEHMKCKHPEVA